MDRLLAGEAVWAKVQGQLGDRDHFNWSEAAGLNEEEWGYKLEECVRPYYGKH